VSGKIPVAILGATGNVGQRFVQLLEKHPWFEVAELVASERSAGKSYAAATDWRLSASMPEGVRDLTVLDTTPTSRAPSHSPDSRVK
jgi:aspartate-semialdehyde dehydrogenase